MVGPLEICPACLGSARTVDDECVAARDTLLHFVTTRVPLPANHQFTDFRFVKIFTNIG